MCGINGILYSSGFNSGKEDEFHFGNIRKMNEAIAHRGPDGEGIFIDYPVCLGHRRLSIIDLSENGSQPMFNEDKSIVLVYNGEIYNYKELIPELISKGHQFNSKCDAEVVIHAYEEYGEDCVKMFNGMWAFVIFDKRKRKLFASRDRFGVKPFYYFKDKEQFIFSSEIKAILEVTGNKNAEHCKVFNYLAYGYRTNDGKTFFQNISELLPAHNLIIENNTLRIIRYWDFPVNKFTGNNIKDVLRELIFDSIRLRFRSDVPVSILLSGGIDSGIIAAVTNEMIEKEKIQSTSVSSYSAVFPGFRYDESDQIKEILSSCPHIDGNFVTPSSDNLAEQLPSFVFGMGEPVFSSTSFAHFVIMQEIKKRRVKVVLNGQGSDEAWCGYGKYVIGYLLLDLLMSKPGKFFSQFNSASQKLGLSTTYIAGQFLKAMLPRRKASYFRSKYSEKIFGCLSKDFVNQNYDCFQNPVIKRTSANNLDTYMKYNIKYQGFNQILHYEDHSSMQSSIEMRSPFIDYRLMELAFSIPTDNKISDGISKKILRETFAGMLPERILNNNRKIGFVTPFDEWTKEPAMSGLLKDTLNSNALFRRNIYQSGKIKGMLSSANSNSNFPLWRILNLELWIRAYGITNL